ncbi:hypothetical protein [Thiorhodospira sibirica]|uniref:hypothetical protein n=1 Tax=Thiorhodospira sibirica TaxID=154347 RepID=UPI00022C52C3|nr:hypothetical protein [Thiorhodospira sibirica]
MSTHSTNQMLREVIATLDALSQRLPRRALLARLQAHARQYHLQIDLITMNMDIPSYLKDFYYSEQIAPLAQKLAAQPFWWVGTLTQKALMLYDSQSRLLWEAKPDQQTTVSLRESQQRIKQLTSKSLGEWRLPSKDELVQFATRQTNPLRGGGSDRLLRQDYWLCKGGRIDLDSAASTSINTNGPGAIIACNAFFADTPAEAFIEAAIQQRWTLKPCTPTGAENLLASLQGCPDLPTLYQPIDWLCARLPLLEAVQFSDPNKGLWEFWGQDAETLREAGIRARNPTDDLKDWNIAIDFGTSSTVVAYDDNGQSKLLRIGVQDFWGKEEPSDYENPTVLEFIDLAALFDAWRSEAYRPGVLWDQVRCSHEALHNLRHNETNPCVVASMLAKLKQWALREELDAPLRITDQAKGFEHTLHSLTLRMPVKGQTLTVGPDDPFDPIELYAWFLGLTINWRGRGLFLRYYMTFPVAYPRKVKDKILASFQRGLQRSLPKALIDQPVFADFTVAELASEPAAYAAAALPLLGIEPTTQGVAYAVFDFGGGTTDFDFGRYRLPNAGEEDEGWEAVFEHFGAAGDRFLGGENLLENLAYLTFLHNRELCRQHRIAFTRPLDADDFPGAEMFLERTQAAQTNTLMLMARLRPFWEQGQLPNSSGVEKIELLNRDGGKVSCELAIPETALTEYLEMRIEQGVHNFLVAMHQAFADQPPEQIHVLLGGNASRSQIVGRLLLGLGGKLFEGNNRWGEWGDASQAAETLRQYIKQSIQSARNAESKLDIMVSSPETSTEESTADPLQRGVQERLQALFGQRAPDLYPYPPLTIDPSDIYRPTAKTGVALGLLRLCPGGVVKVVNHAIINSGGEAPFAFHVGRERLGRFQVGLHQGSPYGEWHELGAPRDGVFNLYYSQLPRAQTGELRIGEPGLYKRRIDLSGELSSRKVFARAIGPDQIEICTATSSTAIANAETENTRTVILDY